MEKAIPEIIEIASDVLILAADCLSNGDNRKMDLLWDAISLLELNLFDNENNENLYNNYLKLADTATECRYHSTAQIALEVATSILANLLDPAPIEGVAE